ncbi:hypothetical protein [Mycobacterium asiaticum]|uniref:hypothetical protein n=1 Tax=Mycobacterium asiaticum TaxID=1790 RepID=UPI0015608480
MVSVLVALGGGIDACATAPDGPAQLAVQQNDRVLTLFSLDQLLSLPQVDVETPHSGGAQVQQGPTVRSVLDATGVTSVDRVRAEGRDPAQTLGANELTDAIILNVTKRNTLKLTGTGLPRDRWVRDVTKLVVNP